MRKCHAMTVTTVQQSSRGKANKTFFKSRDMESDRAVEHVLAVKGQQQKELIGNLLEDEKYQR